MGVTYKAFDVDLHCPVTLKVISEKYLGDESVRLRFLREARTAARVRHTNVASVLHLGRTGNGYFYEMEFVKGATLEHLIKRCGHLDVKLALEITTRRAVRIRVYVGSDINSIMSDYGSCRISSGNDDEEGISWLPIRHNQSIRATPRRLRVYRRA
jgi:serine/threonine protein kinase